MILRYTTCLSRGLLCQEVVGAGLDLEEGGGAVHAQEGHAGRTGGGTAAFGHAVGAGGGKAHGGGGVGGNGELQSQGVAVSGPMGLNRAVNADVGGVGPSKEGVGLRGDEDLFVVRTG